MTTDGKYLSLAQFKQFLLGTRTDPNNTTVLNQGVVNTPDDAILSDILLNAEAAFELKTGYAFNNQSFVAVQPFMSYVDGNGWLHLQVRECAPVTVVSAITYRDLFGGGTTWQTVTFNTANDVIYPAFSVSDTYSRPDSAHVMLWPTPAMPGSAAGQLAVRFSYTAGFVTIPQSLTTLIARMAMYLYKLREMPAGKVMNAPLGTMTVPSNYPPDIMEQIRLWTPRHG